jgi:beta-glucanase (GH16 family)
MSLANSFSDDFDTLDMSRWTPHFANNPYHDWQSRTLASNEELEIYVDPGYKGKGTKPLGLNPFGIQNGKLVITARPTPEHLKATLHDFPYTSGVLTTRNSLLQTYGYFEIRARVPKGRGLWPTFWMLQPGKWPPEIDILETRGHRPNIIHLNLHWTKDGAPTFAGCRINVPDADTKFHSYGVLWTPDAIIRYIDREPVAFSTTRPGLNKPMFMIVNLAVGGTFPGSPDKDTRFPAHLEVDSISAYHLPR